MAVLPAAVQAVVEKYKDEVAQGVTQQIRYRDAWLEPGAIVVQTGAMTASLEGWAAWRVPVTKKGKLEAAEEVVISEPTVHEFLQWAKQQSIPKLRELLK